MGMFMCPGCKRFRNDWDYTSQGICAACIISRTPAPVQKPQRSVIPYTFICKSCGKPTTVNRGDYRIQACYECLNSGKWLRVWARQHNVKLKEGPAPRRGQKDVGRFGA